MPKQTNEMTGCEFDGCTVNAGIRGRSRGGDQTIITRNVKVKEIKLLEIEHNLYIDFRF